MYNLVRTTCFWNNIHHFNF